MASGATKLPIEVCALEVLVFEGHVYLHFTTATGNNRYVIRVDDLKRIVDNPICLNPALSNVLRIWLAERVAQAKREKDLSNE